VGTVGRSVSYSLLPSEIVSRVVVHKSATADLAEGGVAGAVDIQTRKPLQFKQPFTAEALLQAIYADLPGKTDPQFSGLLAWKNEAGNAGVLLQLFSEQRHERRDGQEIFGYGAIDPNSPAAQAHPDLAGVLAPAGINSALFEQTRKRQGGLLDVQLKPTGTLTLDLNAFYSHLDAANYNRSFYNQPLSNFNATDANGNFVGVVPSSYTVSNGTLVSALVPAANYPAGNTNGQLFPAVVDQIYRPGSGAETYYVDLDGDWQASDQLKLSAKGGYTHGVGRTPLDIGYEAGLTNVGMSYQLHGLQPADSAFPGGDTSTFSNVVTLAGWGSHVEAIDSEGYAQLDAEQALDHGVWETLKYGLRYAQHHRAVNWPESASCSTCNGTPSAPLPVWNGATYPANFGSGFGAGPGFLRNVWQLSADAVQAWARQYDTSGGPTTRNWPAELDVKERDTAVYAMADLAGDRWRGNIGLRVVQTRQSTVTNVPGGPNPIGQDNVNGPYTPTTDQHTYTDVLPSANIKFDLRPDLVARFALARTMARADYSALVGAVSLDDNTLTGNGGNPDLKPIRSTNLDASLEWYFAPKSMLSLALFTMDMSSYVTFGVAPVRYYNNTFKKFDTYQIVSPTNIGAKNKGVELGWQQALGHDFGLQANATYTDGKADDGSDVVGNSKTTYNLEAYYETEAFSARLAYTYRSSYLVGLDRSFAQHMAGVSDLAASLNYRFNAHCTLTFDALNLNNPVLKYYGDNTGQPRALYVNGRQYYLGLRMEL
jgi:iron complex outermembrane receptor protein